MAPIVPATLTYRQIATYFVTVSSKTLRRWVATEEFPPPDISIGAKIRLWKRETVERWIEERSRSTWKIVAPHRVLR
jgi:predicted DNA-binding transcriptional regulator AlpA